MTYIRPQSHRAMDRSGGRPRHPAFASARRSVARDPRWTAQLQRPLLLGTAMLFGMACGVPENTSVLRRDPLSSTTSSNGADANGGLAPAPSASPGVGPAGTPDVSPNSSTPNSPPPSSVPEQTLEPVPEPSSTPEPEPTPPVDGAGLGSVPVGVDPNPSPNGGVTPTPTPTLMPDPQPTVTPEPTTTPTGGGFGGQQPAPTEPAPTVPDGSNGGVDSTDSGGDTTMPPTMMEPDNASGDTWTTVYAIFQAKCGGGFCHGANQLPPQLVGEESMVLGGAEARAADIAAVSGVRMPPASSGMMLTPEEEMAIQDWAMSL